MVDKKWKVPAILAGLFIVLVVSTTALYFQGNEIPVRQTPPPSLSPSTSQTVTPTQSTGAALYAQYCSSCHGDLASSTRKGRTAAQIQAAIASVPAMSGLTNLTSAQIDQIAAALAQP